MVLVERRQIKPSYSIYKELDDLCFLRKNLYNATLYRVRQHFFATGKYLSYYDVNKEFTHSDQVDYRALPAKVSKMTQMLVEANFKSFFSKTKTDPKARPPRYLPKDGKQEVTYGKQALSFKKEGFISLSKTNIFIKTKLPREVVQFVRVVHKGNHIVLEIGYEKQVTKLFPNNNIASIDLGVNNLMTVVSNVSKPLIINGKPLKSINQYYNKELAKQKSVLSVQGLKTSKRIQRLHYKKNNKVNDYMHKASRYLVNYLVSNDITKLVVGYNSGWKQNIKLSKKVNQNFVGIPFNRLVKQLKYKCELEGIEVVIQEESYTSKCSFLDNEEVKKRISYLGKRVQRGLFKSSNGKAINADVNGALNILRKYLTLKEAWNGCIYSDLVEVGSIPLVKAINL